MSPLKTNFWFTVIFLIYAIDWADRSLISAVIPSIKEEFGLSDAKAGMMSGFLFIGLGLLAVPTGLLVDRFSRKYMIVIMTSVWSAAIWSMGLATSFTGLAVSRLGCRSGGGGLQPCRLCPDFRLVSSADPRHDGGIFNIAQPLGGGLGAVLAGWITFHYGWRNVFGIMAVPGFVLAALMLFSPDYKTVKPMRETHAVKAGPRKTLAFILRNRTLVLIFLAQLPIVFYIYAATTWSTTFFMRTFNIDVRYAASLLAVATIFVSVGPAVCGWFSDWLTRGNPGDVLRRP